MARSGEAVAQSLLGLASPRNAGRVPLVSRGSACLKKKSITLHVLQVYGFAESRRASCACRCTGSQCHHIRHAAGDTSKGRYSFHSRVYSITGRICMPHRALQKEKKKKDQYRRRAHVAGGIPCNSNHAQYAGRKAQWIPRARLFTHEKIISIRTCFQGQSHHLMQACQRIAWMSPGQQVATCMPPPHRPTE